MIASKVIQGTSVFLCVGFLAASVVRTDEPPKATVRKTEVRKVEAQPATVDRKAVTVAEPSKLERPSSAKATWQVAPKGNVQEFKLVDADGKAYTILLQTEKVETAEKQPQVIIYSTDGKRLTARVAAEPAAAKKAETVRRVQSRVIRLSPEGKATVVKPAQAPAKAQSSAAARYRVIRTNPDGKPVVIAQAAREPGLQLGIQLAPVGAALASQLQLKEGQGVLVAGVLPGSAAAKAGLQRHDLVLAVNGKLIAGAEQMVKMVRASAGKPMLIHFLRGGKKQEVTLAATQAKSIPATKILPAPGSQPPVYEYRLAPRPPAKKPQPAAKKPQPAKKPGGGAKAPAASQQLDAVLKALGGEVPEELKAHISEAMRRQLSELDLDLDEAKGTVRLELHVESDAPEAKVETLKAVPRRIVIGSSPTIPAADNRERQIKLLQQQLNRLQEMIDELKASK